MIFTLFISIVEIYVWDEKSSEWNRPPRRYLSLFEPSVFRYRYSRMLINQTHFSSHRIDDFQMKSNYFRSRHYSNVSFAFGKCIPISSIKHTHKISTWKIFPIEKRNNNHEERFSTGQTELVTGLKLSYSMSDEDISHPFDCPFITVINMPLVSKWNHWEQLPQYHV